MKAKKIPYYILLSLLGVGASLIIGFLSFGGMFALWPSLLLASVSLVLSVSYEGEIYLQNLKGALDKLFFKRDYLKNHLAKEFLLNNFPANLEDEQCPQFFRDYEKQITLLHRFGHQTLDEESRKRKEKIEKKLNKMEKWFAQELFAANNSDEENEQTTTLQTELRGWLKKEEQKNNHSEMLDKLGTRRGVFIGVQIFSAISAVFMGFSTSYLLVGVFEIIPALAFIPFSLLPIAIVPMSLIAGAAYGLLTYNAITDMINNDTLRGWYRKLRNDFKDGVTVRNVFMTIAASVLLLLAITLTICTAGTWWTVVQNTRPIFAWMGKIPGFVMGIISPIITGISTLIFDVENTSDTLKMIDENLKEKDNIFQRKIKDTIDSFKELRERENWWQIFNPARILLTLIVAPLRIVLFLGHLISIGVTADKVPGIPEIVSAILGIVSETFQDMHYFVDHDHHGHSMQDLLQERLGSKPGHTHDVDLPTRILKAIFSPLYFLAALWATGFSKFNRKTDDDVRDVLSLDDAWKQQNGQKKTTTVTWEQCGLLRLADEPTTQNFHLIQNNLQGMDAVIAVNNKLLYADYKKQTISEIRASTQKQDEFKELAKRCMDTHSLADDNARKYIKKLTGQVFVNEQTHQVSNEWNMEEAVYRIERHKQKQLNNATVKPEIAIEKAEKLTALQNNLKTNSNVVSLKDQIRYEASDPAYNRHRFYNNGKTKTQQFLEELPEKIGLSAPIA